MSEADVDIESLISELEGTLPRPTAPPPSRVPAPRPAAALPSGGAAPAAAPPSSLSVDELLKSLDAVGDAPSAPSLGGAGGGASRSSASASASGGGGGTSGGGSGSEGRCTYLCLGAAEAPLGSTRSMAARRACPALRCTACDFAVLAFRAHVAWAAGADYLFFRNVHPDRDRLGARLLASPGAAAYCCQCSWVSVLPSDGLALVRRPGVGALATGAAGPEASSIARDGRVGGQGWLHWVCAGGHE